MLKSGLLRSVTASASRNGWWTTLNTLANYGLYKRSHHHVYDFYFGPAARSISLRPGTSDFSCFRQIFMDGDYELELPQRPDVIVDVGANIGLASVFFTKRYYPSRIIALEPDPSNFEMLQLNTKDIPTVSCYNQALWKHTGHLSLVHGNYDKWGVQVREDARDKGTVEAIDMTTLMQQHKLDHIDLLKIDIEGAEFEVLSTDCSGWLPKVKVLVIELHDHLKKGCTDAFTQAISSIRHKTWTSGENQVVLNLDLL